MSEKKNRRKWTPKEKLRIVLETLQSEGKLSEICRREGLSPTLVYQWQAIAGLGRGGLHAQAGSTGRSPHREARRRGHADEERDRGDHGGESGPKKTLSD